jgi:hypothetical protein
MGNDHLISEVFDGKQCVQMCMFVRYYVTRTNPSYGKHTQLGIVRLKRDGTRAETRFRPSAKRTSLFKSVGTSVQSTAGSRGVRISGSNAGYTMFRGSVKSTGYPTPFASFPFTSPPVRHRVPSRFKRTVTSAKHIQFFNSLRMIQMYRNMQE